MRRIDDEEKQKESETAVSSVIGVVLMVSITVLIAATIGVFVTDIGGSVEEPAVSGVTFNFDYDANSDKMKVAITHPGNVERLYIDKRGGGDRFDENDIIRATGGWRDTLADRNSGGRIVDGNKVVNEEVNAGDTLILDNVTANDGLVLTADRGTGTDETLVSSWEANDWTYRG